MVPTYTQLHYFDDNINNKVENTHDTNGLSNVIKIITKYVFIIKCNHIHNKQNTNKIKK